MKLRRMPKDQNATKRTTIRTRQPRDMRELQLRRCAISAFASEGISCAGHADIARLAQVSVPAVFSYFPTREALVHVVLSELEALLSSAVMSAASTSGCNARDRLVRMVLNCADCHYSHPEYIRIFFNWGAAIQDPSWDRYLTFFNKMLAIFESVLNDGKADGSVPIGSDVKEAALIIAGETSMIIMMLYAGLDRSRIASFIEHYVDAAINFGAGKKDENMKGKLFARSVRKRSRSRGS